MLLALFGRLRRRIDDLEEYKQKPDHYLRCLNGVFRPNDFTPRRFRPNRSSFPVSRIALSSDSAFFFVDFGTNVTSFTIGP